MNEDETKTTGKENPRTRRKPSFYRSIAFLLLLAAVAVGYFTTVGIGTPSALGWDIWSVICPLGYLESLLASKVLFPRALISFVLVVAVTLLVGKAFCGWLCPMGHLQRWIPGPKRKIGRTRADKPAIRVASPKPPKKRTFDSRHGVLLGALASAAVFGFPVFCLVCPVGLTFALVLLVMRLFAFGEATWSVLAVGALLVLEVVFFRSWCHRFCPLGALLSLVSKGNRTLRPTIDDSACLVTAEGKECRSCAANCPESLDIRRPEESARPLTDCTKCRNCAFSCPANAITFLPKRKRSVDDAHTTSNDPSNEPSLQKFTDS